MRVVVWTSATDGAVARIEVPAATLKKGSARVQWLPVAIHAATADEAREKAEAFYQAELDRFAKQTDSRASRLAKMAAARDAKAAA